MPLKQNISNKSNMVGYLQSVTEELNSGLPRETNPASDRVEALNPGPLDYNTSVLNHSVTLSIKTHRW